MDIYRLISRRRTPQQRPADPRQQQNSAGGYSFVLDDRALARRFLILGTDSPTYYQSAEALTRENADVILRLAEEDGPSLVDLIVEVSSRGLAPRQNPALFALAIAASVGPLESRAYALARLPEVARTGTHLFLFAGYVEQFRGWGRALRRAVGSWYLDRPVERLAYQAVKYRQREGWSHRDLLRLTHPRTTEPDRRALFDWITHGNPGDVPRLVEGFSRAQDGEDPARLVGEYGLTWEMLPDAALDHAATWDALLDAGIPQTALLRQLPRLTRLGLAGPFRAGRTDEIVAQLTDPTRLQAARVHPIAVLTALRSYASGVSRGGVTWTPVTELVDALDTAVHAAFETVEPANKRTLIGLDVSASMDQARDSSGILTARDVGAAMALVLAATEPQVGVFSFTTTDQTQWRESTVFSPLAISGRQRLDDAVASTRALPFGGTDCALPMTEATRNGWAVDTFIVITDNETWAGPIHPHQALEHYRRQTGLPARLIVLAVTPTRFSIADPGDAGMLDVVGFGGDVPELVTAFSRGF